MLRSVCGDSLTTQEFLHTEEIPLDYYYEIGSTDSDNQQIMLPLRSANYTPYKLACFKSKMNVFLNEQGMYCTMVPKRFDGKMRQFLEIYDEEGFLPLTEESKEELLPLVKKCTKELPNHIVVFNARQNIILNDTTLSASWMSTIIPYLNPPNHIPDLNMKYIDNIVYASISDNFIFKKGQSLLEKWFRYTLQDLYIKGCIILDPVKDSTFISNWKLEKWNDERLKEDHWLYRCGWKNNLVAPQPTFFLQNIRATNLLTINNDKVVRCNNFREMEEAVYQYFSK